MGSYDFAAAMWQTNQQPEWNYPTAFGYLIHQAQRCASGFISPRTLQKELDAIRVHQREYDRLRLEHVAPRTILEHLFKVAGPDPRGSDSPRGSGATPR